VAAGSAISEDVPEGSMAVARGRQRLIEGWAERWWSRVLETAAPHVQPVIRRWLARREGQTVASAGDSAASNGGEQ
jgi:bifunctional UDP-N-acetylglucosamine pyrophosphorylase/glucosamine-1-phosphate N-acetyltransferase